MGLEIDKIFLSYEWGQPDKLVDTRDVTDVIIYMKNGNRFYASFFPYDKIDELKVKHVESGEFLFGKYFWVKGMLLIEECSRELIGKVLQHLIKEGDFEYVFNKL